MKKLISGILATMAFLACAAGCNFFNKENSGDSSNSDSSVSENIGGSESTSDDSSVGEVNQDLKDAAAFLESSLKSANETDGEVRADYYVTSVIWGFPITWSVDVTEGVTIAPGNDTQVKIDVDENLDEDLTYVLTATLTDENGNTESVSVTRKVLAALAKTPEAITGKPLEDTAYKYHVYQSTLGKDLYFAGSMNGYYFKTTEKYEEAVDIYVEYVEGSDTLFNLAFTSVTEGKQYIGVKVSDDGGHNNLVYADAPVSSFFWSDTYKTIITNILDRDGNQSDFYLGNYSTLNTISASVASQHYGGEGNNVGNLVVMVDRNSVTADSKVAFEKDALSVTTEYIGDKTVELATTGVRYSDVSISWTVSGDNASISDNVLTITAPSAETTVTLTATITCGDVSDTKAFTLTLKPAVTLPDADSEITIPQAVAIGEAQEHDVLTENKYYVSGVVTEVKNNTYGNLYIEDADGNSIYVYGCYDADGKNRYDAMTNPPQVGDSVKLYSAITNYYGSAQLKNAWVVEWTAGEGNEGGDSTSGDSSSSDGSEDVTPTDPLADKIVTAPVADKAYNFYMYQGNKDAVYYLAGDMNGYYLATTTDATAALVVYLETAEGGYYAYCLVDGVKTYLNMVASGTYMNGAYETTASTVYTFNTEYNTIVSDGYFFGTRGDKEYTTMGPCAESYLAENFVAHFIEATNVNAPEGGEGEDSGDSGEDDVTPETPDQIIFEFGENGNAAHVDGNDLGTSKEYTCGDYTLSLTGMSKVYGPAYDAKGNSCIKLGTSSVVGTFTFTVDQSVSKVIIKVAQYKAKDTTVTVNDTEYVISTLSDNGEYTDIEVDTTSTKTITFATVSGKCRAMINSIEFVIDESSDNTGDNTSDSTSGDSSEGEDDTTVTLTPEEIVEKAYALSSGASLSEAYSLTGVIISVDTAYSEQYSNVTVTIIVKELVDNPIMCYRMKGTGADTIKVGDTITVTGTLKNYSGTIEFDTGCTLDSVDTEATVPTSVKIVTEAKALSVPSSISEAGDVTLATVGETYADVAISWVSDNTACAAVNNGVVTFTLPTAATTVTLTATITCGETSKTYTYSVSVAAAPAADALTAGFVSSELGLSNSTEFASHTANEITFTSEQGSNNNATKYYSTGTALRVYAGNIFTISCAEGYKMTSITITTDASNSITDAAWLTNATATGLSTASVILTPTDGTQDVVICKTGTSGNFRIVSISVTYVKL